MYSYFEGKLVNITPAGAVVDCNGIGYSMNISLNTYSRLKTKTTCKLFTHLVVREDALVLYGFADENERQVFRQLISVSGVGANTARLILSSLTPDEVAEAIVSGNVRVLQSIKGIGSKSAQRIIVDLKDKMYKEDGMHEFLGVTHNTAKEEALSALIMLGFNKIQASKTLDQISKNPAVENTVEQLIKDALKIL
ncbi:MAG: Holliday junction branch migration protein RuvA [Bacteroidales bacterium]